MCIPMMCSTQVKRSSWELCVNVPNPCKLYIANGASCMLIYSLLSNTLSHPPHKQHVAMASHVARNYLFCGRRGIEALICFVWVLSFLYLPNLYVYIYINRSMYTSPYVWNPPTIIHPEDFAPIGLYVACIQGLNCPCGPIPNTLLIL